MIDSILIRECNMNAATILGICVERDLKPQSLTHFISSTGNIMTGLRWQSNLAHLPGESRSC